MYEAEDEQMDDREHDKEDSSQTGSVYHDAADSPETSPMSGHTTPRAAPSVLATDPTAFALSSARTSHRNYSQGPTAAQFGVPSFQSSQFESHHASPTETPARPGTSASVPPAFQGQGPHTFSFMSQIPRTGQRRPANDMSMELVVNPWETVAPVLGKRIFHDRPPLFLPDPDSPLNQSNGLIIPTPKCFKLREPELEPEMRYPPPLPHRLRQANTTLAQMNSDYQGELRDHHNPGGAFQKSLLAGFQKDTDAMLRQVRQEHQQRIQKLEDDHLARQRDLDAKERALNARSERLEHDAKAKMDIEEQEDANQKERQYHAARELEEAKEKEARVAQELEEAKEKESRIARELEEAKKEAINQAKIRAQLEQEMEDVRRSKRQTEKLLNDRLEELQARKEEEIAAAIQREMRMHSGKEKDKASSSPNKDSSQKAANADKGKGREGDVDKGKRRDEMGNEGQSSKAAAPTQPPSRDQNRQEPNSEGSIADNHETATSDEIEAEDENPKPKRRPLRGASWATIKRKKADRYARQRPVLEAEKVTDQDVDMDDPEEEKSDDDKSDSDKSDEDDEDEDDTPLTKGALMKVFRKVLKEAKRGGRKSKETKRPRAKDVDSVEEEKEKDEKWQRSSFCRLVGATLREKFKVTEVEDYAIHEPPDSSEIRLFDREEKGGPNKDDLRIDMRGKISSAWNTMVIEILVDAVLKKQKTGEAWDDLPDRSEGYFTEIIQDQLERARSTWRSAQPKILESGEIETLEQVEKRMVESKDASEKIKRANMRRFARYDRRLETIKRTIERKRDEGATDTAIWEWLETLITTLGPEGMSSDESDIDEDTGMEVLHVRELEWRRHAIKEMDFVDGQRRKDKELFSNKGSKPTLRLRKNGRGKTRRKAPKRKPKAVFDKTFLENYKDVRGLKLTKKKMEWLNIGVKASTSRK